MAKRRGGSDAYLKYIRSPEWRVKAKACLDAAGSLCQQCKERRATQAHHLTYERLFDELPTDLLAVCKPCHEIIHGRAQSRAEIIKPTAAGKKRAAAEKRRAKWYAKIVRQHEHDKVHGCGW